MMIQFQEATDELAALEEYFETLAWQSSTFLDALPIEPTPQPLAHALEALAPAADGMKADGLRRLRALRRPIPPNAEIQDVGVGLNTVGMLADRFTILLIKEWSLRHKANANPAKADALARTQTRDIVAALARVRPGTSSLNSKITALRSHATATDWAEAYWGLLTTNLLLWESQEMLYIRDIGAAPCDELRAYISWFSSGNIRRNDYIELVEKCYWQADEGRA